MTKKVVKHSAEKKVIVLTVYLLTAIIMTVQIMRESNYDIDQWVHICSIFAFLLLISQCITIKLMKIGFFSLEFAFLLLMYAFYLGQIFLLNISYDFGELTYSIAYRAYGVEAYIQSTQYSFSCIAFSFLGLILASTKRKVMFYNAKRKEKCNQHSIEYTTAKVMFLISAPFELYSLITKYYAIFVGSYLDAHAAGGGILVEFMSGIFFSAIVYFLIDSTNKPRQCKYIFITIIIYEGLTLLTGQRAMGILKIFICIFIYYKLNKKISWKAGLQLTIGLLIASYALVIIRNSRANGLSMATLNITTNGFILFDVLSEFGITGRVVAATFYKVHKFANGKSLVCSFLAIVPGWSNLFGDNLINKYYTFVALDQQTWGSSFISDFYFDFGFVGGIIASSVYAFIVGLVFNKFVSCLNKRMYAPSAYYAYFVLQLIYTIRSYVFRLPRYFVYFSLIYYSCYLFIKLYSRRYICENNLAKGVN